MFPVMILERLKQFIDYKDIAISAFEKSIGMSNASFGKSLKNGGTIGADKLGNILHTYPEINLYWLITGEGNMLNSDQPEKTAETPGTEKAALFNVEMLLRDMLAEERAKNDALNEVIWELKEENGKLKALLGNERKGETAANAGFSSAADAV